MMMADEVAERPQIPVGFHNNTAATPAVSAVRASARNVSFFAETTAAVSAVASATRNCHSINKHGGLTSGRMVRVVGVRVPITLLRGDFLSGCVFCFGYLWKGIDLDCSDLLSLDESFPRFACQSGQGFHGLTFATPTATIARQSDKNSQQKPLFGADFRQ